MLCSLALSASAAAHTDADFTLAEGEARAGDAVHFSLTGTHGQFTYELEIGSIDVVEDTSATGPVSAQFTLPHLGNSQRTVVVKAVIRETRHKTTVTRKLRYLGPAVAPPRPDKPAPAEKPAPEPAPEPMAQAAPAPLPSLSAPASPASAPAAAQQDRQSGPASRAAARQDARRHAKRRKGSPRRTTSVPASRERRSGHRRASAHHKGRTRGRLRARTAPLFDGVPERGIRGGSPAAREGYATPNAIVPPALVSTRAPVSDGKSGIGTALLVPGFMGLAALALAGTAAHRKRRLRRSL